jgi:hypothetical protein
LLRLSHGRFTAFTEKDGLPSNRRGAASQTAAEPRRTRAARALPGGSRVERPSARGCDSISRAAAGYRVVGDTGVVPSPRMSVGSQKVVAYTFRSSRELEHGHSIFRGMTTRTVLVAAAHATTF